MNRLSSQLRIGEKIGLGFAVVCLLFFAVVGYYHHTLRSVTGDYKHLLAVFETRKSLALAIEIEMAAVRDAEKAFLIAHKEQFAQEVDEHLQVLFDKLALLAAVDEDSRQTVDQLRPLLTGYRDSFHAVAEAWRSMGLDENSGVQGAFRSKIHRLHELAGRYSVDRLYAGLLQLRRHEKDLALRRDLRYAEQVRRQVGELVQMVKGSELPAAVKAQLLNDLRQYAQSFEPFARELLAGGNANGGMGRFRDAAHRIEAVLKANHVPHLENSILQLRRREKDFLLRGDESYPPMVAEIARGIRAQIAASAIADADKALLSGLLNDYQSSFFVLVAQRARIAALTRAMDAAAQRVAPLLTSNSAQANQMMSQRIEETSLAAQTSARLAVGAMLAATILGALFAVLITRRIVRPLREMAGLLDNLAYGAPTPRVAAVPGGRDEVNAMALSLNALIGHRANFLAWWKSSLQEMNAERTLQAASSRDEREQAIAELRAVGMARVEQLNAMHGRLLAEVDDIIATTQRVQSNHSGTTFDDAKRIEHAAREIATLLEIVGGDLSVPANDAGSPSATAPPALV